MSSSPNSLERYSFVRSVSMDSFSDEQLRKMKVNGIFTSRTLIGLIIILAWREYSL